MSASETPVSLELDPPVRDVAGLPVRRALPSVRCRAVGPFVFLDHMGPTTLPAGVGVDVPPHPHIGLATVTYLFEGGLEHRDSLGIHQPIRPGAMNWMSAGRGIVHSERSGDEERAHASRQHGMQAWVALPREHEESEPGFAHHAAETLPTVVLDRATARVLVGTAFGASSPVATLSPLVYVELLCDDGATLTLDDPSPERALYLVSGRLAIGGATFVGPRLLVLRVGVTLQVEARGAAHAMLLGGPPLDARRTVHWNFVSSSKERIERAREDWSAGRFPPVPGDDGPPVPLPR